MRQSRKMSMVEAVANVVVGYGVAVAAQVMVFPLFGLYASLSQNLRLGIVFKGSLTFSAAARLALLPPHPASLICCHL